MKVEIWSDIVCPWCYVGSRNFDKALAAFAHGDDIEVGWRSYELDPHAPAERPGTYIERLTAKYGITADEARARVSRVVSAGDRAGIDFRFEKSRPGNTFDAHRLLHLAATLGLQGEMKERLFAATFEEGHPIATRDVVKLAPSGIPRRMPSCPRQQEFGHEDVRRGEAVCVDVPSVPV